jgi:hypothetical protein
MPTTNPKSGRGFFDNYEDHLNQLGHNIEEQINISLRNSNRPTSYKSLLNERPIRRGTLAKNVALFSGKSFSNTDRPFSDRYDVTDEVLGALAMPILQNALGCICLGASIYEAGLFVAIKTGLKTDDRVFHGHEALLSLEAAVIFFYNSFIYAFLSSINLVSRSIFTALDGYSPPEKNRFVGGEDVDLGFFGIVQLPSW